MNQKEEKYHHHHHGNEAAKAATTMKNENYSNTNNAGTKKAREKTKKSFIKHLKEILWPSNNNLHTEKGTLSKQTNGLNKSRDRHTHNNTAHILSVHGVFRCISSLSRRRRRRLAAKANTRIMAVNTKN